MIKKSLYIAYTVVLLAMITSCSKILDLEPHDSTFTGAYFTTENDANTAISGAYALVRRVFLTDNSYHLYGDVVSGELAINSGYDDGSYNISLGQFIGLNVGSNRWNWQTYYQIIQQVNQIIANVPKIDDSKFSDITVKRHVMGEAYFLRAFTYFYMTRIWGDVPLKLLPDNDAFTAKNYPRSKADSVQLQALADLQIAKTYLDFGYTDETQRAVRANKGSVYALEAHIAAWRKDYVACDSATLMVMNKGGYQLVDSAHMRNMFIGRSIEGIFEISIDNSQNEGIGLTSNAGGTGLGVTMMMPFIPGKGYIEWPVSSFYVNQIYKDSAVDARYRNYFYQSQSGQGQIVKYSNITEVSSGSFQYPVLSNNINIFRLADIMLLRAEALNALNRPGEAIDLLNQVRERSGCPDYVASPATPLAKYILEERLRELFYEGQSYYDLVRTGFLTDYNQNFPGAQLAQGGWMWPIDPSMFKDDFTLTQTPYWRGKL
jgi:starch-binding outer membrane protein, SusD/RagB family